MLKIKNIDKLLAINSQSVEIETADERPEYYEFTFFHKSIHSAFFTAHMERKLNSVDQLTYTMNLYDGINNLPWKYNFVKSDITDPFALLKYLNDVITNWVILTKK